MKNFWLNMRIISFKCMVNLFYSLVFMKVSVKKQHSFSTKPITCITTSSISLIVATLALGSQPRQGFVKVQAKIEPRSHISCSRECKRVSGNQPSHSQVNSHFRNWCPNGLLNFQRAIARSKLIGLRHSLCHWKDLGT